MKKYLTLIIIYIIFSCTPPLEIKEIKGITLKAPKPENIEMFIGHKFNKNKKFDDGISLSDFTC